MQNSVSSSSVTCTLQVKHLQSLKESQNLARELLRNMIQSALPSMRSWFPSITTQLAQPWTWLQQFVDTKSSDNTVVKIDYFQFYFTILSMLQSIVLEFCVFRAVVAKSFTDLHRIGLSSLLSDSMMFYSHENWWFCQTSTAQPHNIQCFNASTIDYSHSYSSRVGSISFSISKDVKTICFH